MRYRLQVSKAFLKQGIWSAIIPDNPKVLTQKAIYLK